MSSKKKRNTFDSESEDESEEEEVIQTAIQKKPTKQIKSKAAPVAIKKKNIQKPEKQQSTKINAELKKMLNQKIEDNKILQQLEKKPLNFGDDSGNRNRKILLVEEKVKTTKLHPVLGVSLIHQKKSLPRQGTNRMSNLVMQRTNHLRGSMNTVRSIKAASSKQ